MDKKSELNKLVKSALKNASSTIGDDLRDAIDSSKTDDELIANWQSALEGLKNEVEHYWSSLEKLKQ